MVGRHHSEPRSGRRRPSRARLILVLRQRSRQPCWWDLHLHTRIYDRAIRVLVYMCHGRQARHRCELREGRRRATGEVGQILLEPAQAFLGGADVGHRIGEGGKGEARGVVMVVVVRVVAHDRLLGRNGECDLEICVVDFGVGALDFLLGTFRSRCDLLKV